MLRATKKKIYKTSIRPNLTYLGETMTMTQRAVKTAHGVSNPSAYISKKVRDTQSVNGNRIAHLQSVINVLTVLLQRIFYFFSDHFNKFSI